MGHANTGMINKTDGQWILEDEPNYIKKLAGETGKRTKLSFTVGQTKKSSSITLELFCI